MKKIEVSELNDNVFTTIGKEWMLVTAGTKDKEDLTGYHYESWHIRYVGKDLAKKVEESQLTFDEYYARHY